MTHRVYSTGCLEIGNKSTFYLIVQASRLLPVGFGGSKYSQIFTFTGSFAPDPRKYEGVTVLYVERRKKLNSRMQSMSG